MMKALDLSGDTRRHWACDSFRGIPPPEAPDKARSFGYVGAACNTEVGASSLGRGTRKALCSKPKRPVGGSWASSRSVFEKNVRMYNVSSERLRIVEGYFASSLPPAHLSSIAFLRLDGDLYNSTRDALERLEPLVSKNGYIYVDDYGSFRGCAAAVDEYRRARGLKESLHPITAGVRGKFQALWWVKK